MVRVPDSLRAARFEIVAKSAGKISGDEYWEMLRALLEDRFKLKFHRDKRELAVYAIRIAKGGPKLNPAVNLVCCLR